MSDASDGRELARPSEKPVFPQVTGQAAADTFGFSRRWLSKLAEDGYVERKENGLFDLGEVGIGYVRFLEDARDRRADEQDSRLRKLQLEKLQLEMAKMRDSLCSVYEAEKVASEIFAVLRCELSKVGPLVEDPCLGAKVARGLEQVFNRHEAAFASFFANVRAGTPDLTGFEEENADT